jgi:hypothetical protein
VFTTLSQLSVVHKQYSLHQFNYFKDLSPQLKIPFGNCHSIKKNQSPGLHYLQRKLSNRRRLNRRYSAAVASSAFSAAATTASSGAGASLGAGSASCCPSPSTTSRLNGSSCNGVLPPLLSAPFASTDWLWSASLGLSS